MFYVIGDIGNTSTRICLLKKSKIIKSIIFDTKKIFSEVHIKKILNIFLKKKINKKILFSCVVPLALKKLLKCLKKLNIKFLKLKNLI